MVLRGQLVEMSEKIAMYASSGRRPAVDLLPWSTPQRSKLSPRISAAVSAQAAAKRLFRRKSERPLEPLGVGRPDIRIDDARRPLAVERVEDLLGGDLAHVDPGFPGDTRGVRARQHVVELQQRM